jgi:hypothetical protein
MMRLAVALVSVAFATSALAARPEKPIVLPSRTGAVTFQHSTHASLKCTQCHKDDQGGAIEGFRKASSKNRAHAACHECHKKERKGPQKCADCHRKA